MTIGSSTFNEASAVFAGEGGVVRFASWLTTCDPEATDLDAGVEKSSTRDIGFAEPEAARSELALADGRPDAAPFALFVWFASWLTGCDPEATNLDAGVETASTRDVGFVEPEATRSGLVLADGRPDATPFALFVWGRGVGCAAPSIKFAGTVTGGRSPESTAAAMIASTTCCGRAVPGAMRTGDCCATELLITERGASVGACEVDTSSAS